MNMDIDVTGSEDFVSEIEEAGVRGNVDGRAGRDARDHAIFNDNDVAVESLRGTKNFARSDVGLHGGKSHCKWKTPNRSCECQQAQKPSCASARERGRYEPCARAAS